MNISFVPLSPTLYPAFYALVQSTQWGNPMLPVAYNNSLWGMLVQDSSETIVGGWVGTLRGNAPLVRCIAKSVYFDSYPVFCSPEDEVQYLPRLMEVVKQYARRQHIVMLNLTHWVRGNCSIFLDKVTPCATFYYDLSLSMESLYNQLDRLKKRTIKKAEANQLDVQFFAGKEAIPYIPQFQALRKETQQRAIEHNQNASMLLKSDTFFERLFATNKTTLAVVRTQDGKIVAAATFIESGATVYAHMSGSDAEANRTTGSGTYYYWKAVEYFRGKDLKQFDFGGCPVEPSEDDPAFGVFMFKRGFGGTYLSAREGQVIISKQKYRLLNFLLSQRKLLRLLSKRL